MREEEKTVMASAEETADVVYEAMVATVGTSCNRESEVGSHYHARPFGERSQLVKRSMQLFSVDQHHSQAREAHAASFASFRVPGNDKDSILIFLRQRHPMLDRLSQNCMLLSLEPSQSLARPHGS